MAVDWTKHAKTDNVRITHDSSGITYRQTYFLLTTDGAYRASRGDASDSTVVSGWKVNSAEYEPLSPFAWLATITFTRFAGAAGSNSPIGRSYAALKNQYELNMGQASFRITPEMLGIISANSVEPIVVRNPTTGAIIKTVTKASLHLLCDLEAYGLPGYVPSEWKQYLTSGIAYRAPLLATDWAPATKVPAGCPFTRALAADTLDKDLNCDTASVTVYLDDPPSDTGRWKGINDGSNFPVTSISGSSTPALWKAVDQSIQRILGDDGTPFYAYTRTAMRTPNGLSDRDGSSARWKSAANGGPWSVDWPSGVTW